MRIIKDDFIIYEEVRRLGITNMCNVSNVEEITGLSRYTILYIMKNYDKLTEQYPDVIEDTIL